MKKYNNIDELDARIERIITKKVEAYYSDWKNYDRPKYMGLKGSADKANRNMILIARKCGTYLFSMKDLNRENPRTICRYYIEQEAGAQDYYYIDLDRLTINKMDPAEVLNMIKEYEREAKAA